MRIGEQTMFVATNFVATVARISPMIVVVFLATALSTLAATNMALVAMNVSLAVVRVALAVARVLGHFLEQYLESSRIGSCHTHQARQMDQAKHRVHLMGRKADLPSLLNHREHEEVAMDLEPHTIASTLCYLTQTDQQGSNTSIGHYSI